ncbi:MAG: outer membrane beta-barrel protein [Prolixibacteraceae bacterium]|nr:outer membrane beta-barrel protein [Prolixibacteraceae bacterium]
MKRKWVNRLIVTLIPLFIFTVEAFSQSLKLPENKHSNNFSYERLQPYLNRKIGYNLGWNSTTFTNPVFAKNIADGVLKNKIGIDFFVRQYHWSCLFTDYDFSLSTFENNQSTSFTQYAGKFSISAILLPVSKFFLPYAGVGYQLSVLGIPDDNENSSDILIASSNTSCFFWKSGAQSFITNKFSIHFEYSQSIITKKTTNSIGIGVGIYY